MQSIRQAELAVRQAENGVLDATSARLELQGLTGRLAAQQQQLASSRHAQELQGIGSCPPHVSLIVYFAAAITSSSASNLTTCSKQQYIAALLVLMLALVLTLHTAAVSQCCQHF